MAVYKDELYVAGRLQEVAGAHEQAIMRWNGEKWNTAGNISYVNNDITCMAVYKDELYIGGLFKFTASGKTAWNIAKWNGKVWTPVGPGLVNSVSSLVVYKDELYVGGSFLSTYGKKTEVTWLNGIGKWDGQKWSQVGEFKINANKIPSFGTPVYDRVYSLAVYKDELYAAGYFLDEKIKYTHCIQKWNGSEWEPLAWTIEGNHTINKLTVYHDNLIAVGEFGKSSGKPTKNIAKWNGTEWSDCGGGTNGIINTAFVYNDEIWLTGIFTKVGDKEMKYMAKYKE